MKEFINELNLEIVSKLLNGNQILLKDSSKKEDHWLYPENTETLSIDKSNLTQEEVVVLKRLDFISEYLKNQFDFRSAVWIVNPDKLELLKDLKLHFKIKRSLEFLGIVNEK